MGFEFSKTSKRLTLFLDALLALSDRYKELFHKKLVFMR